MATAAEMVQAYTDAEMSVLRGQSVRMGDRILTRADLAEIRAGRREWQAAAAREAGGGGVFKAADFRGACE